MRAVICEAYGDLSNLKLGELPEPKPGKGEVAIALAAAGVNFPDLLLVRGLYQFRPDPPFAPGGEGAGRVTAVGEGVDPALVGQEVFATALSGAFAETMVARADALAPIPAGLSPGQAAGVGITYGTSLYALKERAGLRAGETLLVLGAAGGVGLAAVQIGKAMGATVIAAASNAEKVAAALEAGADHGIDYGSESLKDRVKALTGGRGPDVIYDPVGGALTEQAFRTIAWDGRHLVIGFAAGEIPKLPLNLMLLKNAAVVGVFWGTWTQRDPAGAQANLEILGRWLEEGTLRPRVKTYPIEQFADALAEVDQRRVIGKVVLDIAPPAV